ncbi:MAG: transporter substrate-binding domain-containing protein [Xenococcaceae cyanobacterium]
MIISRIQLPIFLVIFLVSAPVSAQEPQVQKLRVGTAGSPPFVINDGPNPEGISIDIWREIARSEELEYELIPQKGVRAGIDAVAKDELDLVIGPISITADRHQKVTFTQPYFLAEIGLMLPSHPPSLWSIVKPFFELAVISSVSVMFCAIFVVGNLLWLTERRRNSEQFPKEYVRGVGNGMWFALVTLTTVGYGDRTPVTKTGRLIASVWMLVTMVTASSLTAALTTAFTLSLSQQPAEQFRHPEDLRDARMAVVSGTTGAEWAAYYKARLIETETLEEAMDRLASGKVDGVVFDVPALRYYLRQYPEVSLRLAEFSFASEDYGFVLPLESPLLQKLNVKLLQLKQEGQIKAIEDKWLY